MSFSSILTVMIQSSIEDLVLLWSLPNRPFSLVDFLFPMQIKSCDDTQESVFFQNDRHFHARTQSFYWKRQRFKCPRYRHMIGIGKTNSTSEKGLLLHHGSTLVLELGPHKDREKLWPGWDLNSERSLLALKEFGFLFGVKEFYLVSKASLHRCVWKGWRGRWVIWGRSILKTLALKEKGHVTTVKFRRTCLELVKATAKCFKREVEQVFRRR